LKRLDYYNFTDMKKTVRNYIKEDRIAVFDIIYRNYNREISAEFKSYFDWKQKLTPIITKNRQSSLVIENNNAVEAYLCIIPSMFKIGSQYFEAGFVCDLISDPKKRGVGIKLMKEILKSQYIHFGAPGQRVETLWKKIGKDVAIIKPLNKVIGLVNPVQPLSRKGVPAIISKIFAFFWKSVLRLSITADELGYKRTLVLTREDDFPEEVDNLANEFSKGFFGINIKSRAFLAWRFCESPFQYEKIFVRENEKLIGYLIYRQGTIKGDNVILIIEAISIDEKLECYTLMLNHIYKQALKTDISYILTNDSGCEKFWKVLKNKFVFKRNLNTNIISDYSCAKLPMQPDNGSPWFFSIADSDFEFANFKLD